MRALLRRIRRRGGERGTIAPLIIAFGVAIIMLLVVVTDAAQLWVYQRGLHSLADGASLDAANAIDKSSLYSQGIPDDDKIAISAELAQEAVNNYVAIATADDAASSEGVECTVAVGAGGTEVTVTCNGLAKLPIVGYVTEGQSEVPVQSSATAQTFSSN